MKKQIKVYVDLYEIALNVFIGYTRDEYIDHMKSCGIEIDPTGVGHFYMNERHTVVWVNPTKNQYEFMRYLTHEILHVVINSLDFRGIPISIKNEESMTYLMGYIMREVCKELKVGYKQK